MNSDPPAGQLRPAPFSHSIHGLKKQLLLTWEVFISR